MGLKKILHSDLAKSLIKLAADTAAPGVRPAVEQIIKDSRNGVYSEGAIRQRLDTLTSDADLNDLIGEAVTKAYQDLLDGIAPKFMAGYALYHPDGHRIFGSARAPAWLPGTEPATPIIVDSQNKPMVSINQQGDLLINETRDGTGFRWGAKSLEELNGVHPILQQVATLALTKYATQDFMIFDGLRTTAEQAEYVKKGTSTTMNSMHLPQADGLGHAIDCVPVVNGKPVWDWDRIYPVIFAIDQAATELGVADKLVWGGAWDRRLSDFGGSPEAYKTACKDYAERFIEKYHRAGFVDGPHIELRL